MQQTSGSSFLNLNPTVGDETNGDESAVDEVPVVVVSFLLMVCGNCARSFCLERWVGCNLRWSDSPIEPRLNL